MSLISWTKNPVVLAKILNASQGGFPMDIIEHIVPGCDYLFGPWLHYYVSKYYGWHRDLPFRLEDKNPPSLNKRFPIKKRILKEKHRMKENQDNQVILDPTRVQIQVEKHHGTVVMRSKFSVMVRFFFWFCRQAQVDPWTSFHVSFQTECYMHAFFRIKSISQLEAEIDWLIAWVSMNNMVSFGLPTCVFQVDVLTLIKQAIRSKSLPLDNCPNFGYATYRLNQIIPSLFHPTSDDGDSSDKLDLLVLGLSEKEIHQAKELCWFVCHQVRAHFRWHAAHHLEAKVDHFMFRLVYNFEVFCLLQLQNLAEDLLLFSRYSSYLCGDLLRLLSTVLTCQQPNCYNWKDGFWRKVDELGQPLLSPNEKFILNKRHKQSQQVQEASHVSDWSIQSDYYIQDDFVMCGGQMPHYAFHTGIGFKQVVTANSMDFKLKEALLGRTNSYNSEGNVVQAMVAKIPLAHVFCPGKFSFSETTDKHLFYFLLENVAKISTNKTDRLCRAWSFKMTNALKELGIETVVDLCHDLCCVPSSTLMNDNFNDADRTAILLAFWQVQELQFFNLSYFTNVEVFDWKVAENPPATTTTHTITSYLECVHEPTSHEIPLHIYLHDDAQKRMQQELCKF